MQLENVESFYPLTPLQQGILFHSVSDPTSRMYFNQTLMTLVGELDVDEMTPLAALNLLHSLKSRLGGG